MINLFQLWAAFQSQANTWQGGFWAPQTDFTTNVNIVQKEIMQDYVSRWQENQIGTDKLKVFLKTRNIKLAAESSRPYDTGILPVDYQFFSSLRVLVNNGSPCGCKQIPVLDSDTNQECDCPNDDKYVDPDILALQQAKGNEGLCEASAKLVDNQRWGAVCESRTKKPTIYKPVASLYDGGFKVYPKGMGILVLDYFRKPKDAVFAYTLGPNDEIQFDPTNSVNLEWDEIMIPEFIDRLLKKYAIFTGQEQLYQIGEIEKQQVTK
jgi:hypothetical protein